MTSALVSCGNLPVDLHSYPNQWSQALGRDQNSRHPLHETVGALSSSLSQRLTLTLVARRSASAHHSSQQQLDSITHHKSLRHLTYAFCICLCTCVYDRGYLCAYIYICRCVYVGMRMYVFMHCLCILLSTGTVPLKCILCMHENVYIILP